MALSGWRISYYVKEAKNCDYEENHPDYVLDAAEQLAISMEYLHTLHWIPIDQESINAFAKEYDAGDGFVVKKFDDVEEGKKLMRIASATK